MSVKEKSVYTCVVVTGEAGVIRWLYSNTIYDVIAITYLGVRDEYVIFFTFSE